MKAFKSHIRQGVRCEVHKIKQLKIPIPFKCSKWHLYEVLKCFCLTKTELKSYEVSTIPIGKDGHCQN